ncbi:CsbD family protein [Parenemella sanctibonifatiensis]|uniref:General stress protein CsbD n=1 Tax=Parenemella sanctibonifatiensis TaxID=2016505 RepID=A0A255EC05_9ACTN|nr:CsbD family protein [Parenemella sanctibonifatiensis]OYN89094.1 general stress protein CsbD [Parenemella sanctibonifatiensis]
MGLGDKISNQKDKLVGQGKEAFGKATDNEDLQAEGASEKLGAQTKQAGEDVKDAGGKAADKLGDAANRFDN